MLGMHSRHTRFTYSICGPFNKSKERIKNSRKQENQYRYIHNIYIYIYIYIYQLDKACFQRDMAYGDYKDLNGRTAADKYYVKKHLILLNIQNMIDINVDLFR